MGAINSRRQNNSSVSSQNARLRSREDAALRSRAVEANLAAARSREETDRSLEALRTRAEEARLAAVSARSRLESRVANLPTVQRRHSLERGRTFSDLTSISTRSETPQHLPRVSGRLQNLMNDELVDGAVGGVTRPATPPSRQLFPTVLSFGADTGSDVEEESHDTEGDEMLAMMLQMQEFERESPAQSTWLRDILEQRNLQETLSKRRHQLQEEADKIRTKYATRQKDIEQNKERLKRLPLSFGRATVRVQRSASFCERLDTFTHWPLWAAQCPVELAEQGMRYSGDRDSVQCDKCPAGYCHFDPEDDDPLTYHLQSNPDCSSARQLLESLGGDLPPTNSSNELGIPRDRAFYRRVKTFDAWPVWAKQRPHNLAPYGYVYSGFMDITYCESCETRVQNWQEEDSAFESLIRHTSRCAFVLNFFGEEPETGKWGLLNEERLEAQQPGFWERWQTFITWPRTARVAPVDLIKQGFMYTQNADFVQCTKCQVILGDWHESDDIARKHNCTETLAHERPETEALRESLLPPLVEQPAMFSQPRMQHTATVCNESESLLCILCCSAVPNVLFQLCRHVVVCEKCAVTLAECPVCRHPMVAKEQVVFVKDNSGLVCTECIQCTKRKQSYVLKPCCHVCVCESCLPKTEACPICNKAVVDAQRIYLP